MFVIVCIYTLPYMMAYDASMSVFVYYVYIYIESYIAICPLFLTLCHLFFNFCILMCKALWKTL